MPQVPRHPHDFHDFDNPHDTDQRRSYLERRDARYGLRSKLWRLSTLDRLRTCGRHRYSSTVAVKLRDGIAHLSGVETCGSVWSCPCCAPKIRERRALEIEEGLAQHLGAGGGVSFVTVTVPHDRTMRIADVWDTVQTAWTKTWSGKSATSLRARLGIVGSIRTVEVTFGPNGPHPHVHALILTEHVLSSSGEMRLYAFLIDRWRKFVTRAGYGTPCARWGMDFERVALVNGTTALGRYLAKVRAADTPNMWNLGRELARSDRKRSRLKDGTTPMQLAAIAVETGETWAVRLWQEWEQASKGRRCIMWSRGLRARLGLGSEQTDEEIAAEEVDGEPVLIIDGPDFDRLCATSALADLLRLIERTPESAHCLVRALGLRGPAG